MHHTRRKSGHGSANTSLTDVRDAASSRAGKGSSSSRPAPTSRRSSQNVQKLGKNPREREREWEEERWWDEERESFPQYCMTCEKQFVPQDERHLYCSEACRVHDQNSATAAEAAASYYGDSADQYPFYSADYPEPRDIVPRASPSRPTSTHFSPPTTPTLTALTTTGAYQQSAVSALKKTLTLRSPPSPPSPASIWPFASRSAAASPSAATTSSYWFPRPAATAASSAAYYSSTYDGYYYYGGAEQAPHPQPSRRPGGGSGYARPKSIELVTPIVGR